ncbi:hypothetical protein HBI56_152450 [Parastagonospora nodorum]|uniref:Uncharacterized protein n=1 Tax=Phaeosphaeria nodorum (strain SN15 / ATCC MYA-4574 / FGSC 10173) TaxID=321614 RepID=A0A7U2FFC4_PHANO|nr:hypothetical protein HBH56_182060 [Parastagonospora nodorum]QRD04230.1 hypothetical protein JI435_129620 [Parastagonospora nodorum SN15]KAH3926013.1 hypothetical protein HBH54_171210 [Parastagonospora nodorum]KAH3944955.1 hypothetical protein HBH53_153710 [Parastagonospora nodorum]KAH3960586.1 hypothetical protein HBH52_236290 [Parastagonospora nodorum]
MASTAFAYVHDASEDKVQARAITDESNNLLAPRQKYVGAGGSTAPFSAAAFLFPLAAMVAYGL